MELDLEEEEVLSLEDEFEENSEEENDQKEIGK